MVRSWFLTGGVSLLRKVLVSCEDHFKMYIEHQNKKY